jgi:hypothetical protein
LGTHKLTSYLENPDVISSTMDGMLFESRRALYGQQVFIYGIFVEDSIGVLYRSHFGMYWSELIIRTRRGEEVNELLPLKALQGDFPDAPVQEQVHWLDHRTGLVEWRLLTDAWTAASHNWRMKQDRSEEFLI